MARYLQFHINEGALDGQRLLRQDLAETMYAPPNPAALDAEYALGIGTANWQGTRRFQHGGGGFGFNSNMVWYPELKLGAVVVSNADDVGQTIQIVDDVLNSIISADIPLYHSRASPLPSVRPAYSFIQNGPALLTDTALRDLIASKALPLDEADRQRHQAYIGSYVQTRWGVPLIDAQVTENNGALTVTALDQTFGLTEVEPGLFFDPQGNFYNFHLTVTSAPNFPLFKIDHQLLPFRLAFYTICGLIFLSTLLFRPLRVMLRRIRRKNSPAELSDAESPPSQWLKWIGMLSGLASLFGLLCLGLIAFFPDLMYVPWPRPYVDLLWWQFGVLSLPFAGLVLPVVVAVLAGLSLKSQANERAIGFYYLGVAVALQTFNLVLIL
jgi:hypothetical protein